MHETQKVIQWKKVLRSLYTTLFQCYTDDTLNFMEVDLVVPISIIAVGAASLEPYFGSSEAALTAIICRKISQSHRRASRRRSDIMHRALECWHGWASLPVVLPRGRNLVDRLHTETQQVRGSVCMRYTMHTNLLLKGSYEKKRAFNLKTAADRCALPQPVPQFVAT